MQTALSLFDEEIVYNKIHRSHATFLSGIEKAVHKWFRLTPSFGPDLVKLVLIDFDYDNNSIVLDPFAGACTTLIECQLLDIKSYGFEINPFLYFVGKTSLNWKLSNSKIKEAFVKIENTFNENKQLYSRLNCEEIGIDLPKIHNVYRWWREDVLKDLLLLKSSIIKTTEDLGIEYRNFFYLCLAGVLVPDLTNVTLGKLQLHFIDRSKHQLQVFKTFKNHFLRMFDDLMLIQNKNITRKAELYLTDSTELNGIVINDKIDFVVTSPPYPNRYSYVWNTRPFLYFFDFFSKPKEASDLDIKTIGGTWGTATSVLTKGELKPINDIVHKYVSPVTSTIKKEDLLMANYVMKYFNLLIKQLIEMDKILSKKAKIAYIVGNSRIKGTYVETDNILMQIIKDLELGYKKTKVNRFRKRNSGKDLFESIVYAEK